MAAPGISSTVSVVAYRRGEFFVLQLAASGSPTGWEAEGLPEGVEIDEDGKISGAADEPGFYRVLVRAENGDGDSDDFYISMGIEAVDFNVDAFVELNVDIATGRVSNPAIPTATKEDDIIVFAKEGDWLLLGVGFTKNGVLLPLAISQLDLALKEFEDEGILVITDGSFATVGSFDTTRLQIAVKMDPAKLTAALSGYEDDRKTAFKSVAELRWGLQHILPGGVDPTILEGSSQNFAIEIARDIAPDIEEEEE